MRDDLFQELLQNAREAGAWLRGEHVEEIRVTFVGEPDPREVRARLGMTREALAAALCITVDDLRRWEQGHRDSNSAAARLLWIAENHPSVFVQSAARTNAG
ncbi:helix-turn-helix domain-containing protein [Longimicrobium sp.]|uniref:helix-turn-helix domain-containing protein n=1 Tax=Longimicrobium sp. TaxID=2029185 RepID=UPI002E32D4B5|nr:helix-turn-helix domain-containing protein [Longimicrobium sp.]HEX6042536.1 helix-turn-helix domain-containing protein [Longimicrobium sp.]